MDGRDHDDVSQIPFVIHSVISSICTNPQSEFISHEQEYSLYRARGLGLLGLIQGRTSFQLRLALGDSRNGPLGPPVHYRY